jgi:hypothetical protein
LKTSKARLIRVRQLGPGTEVKLKLRLFVFKLIATRDPATFNKKSGFGTKRILLLNPTILKN